MVVKPDRSKLLLTLFLESQNSALRKQAIGLAAIMIIRDFTFIEKIV